MNGLLMTNITMTTLLSDLDFSFSVQAFIVVCLRGCLVPEEGVSCVLWQAVHLLTSSWLPKQLLLYPLPTQPASER